ncbi:unannotated protein [freshwater metagenome]|uniref:Unannotated protein n=1 Tax=freshwater metagenome TaxID=449393 RepID=A0A6J7R7X4_9ZZZZ
MSCETSQSFAPRSISIPVSRSRRRMPAARRSAAASFTGDRLLMMSYRKYSQRTISSSHQNRLGTARSDTDASSSVPGFGSGASRVGDAPGEVPRELRTHLRGPMGPSYVSRPRHRANRRANVGFEAVDHASVAVRAGRVAGAWPRALPRLAFGEPHELDARAIGVSEEDDLHRPRLVLARTGAFDDGPPVLLELHRGGVDVLDDE